MSFSIAFLLQFLQDVTGAIVSDDFLFTTTAGSDGCVVAVSQVSGESRLDLNGAVLLWNSLGELDVLDWNSVVGLDGHNLDNGLSSGGFNSWGLGRGRGGARGGCLGGARGSGDFVLNSGVTNNTVALVVSDVSHDVFNSVSTGEPKRYRVD